MTMLLDRFIPLIEGGNDLIERSGISLGISSVACSTQAAAVARFARFILLEAGNDAIEPRRFGMGTMIRLLQVARR